MAWLWRCLHPWGCSEPADDMQMGTLQCVMKRTLLLTTDPLDEAAWVKSRPPWTNMGAIVTFSGVVRDQESGQPINGLEYEEFRPMVEHQFGLLFDAMERQWPQVVSVRLAHRVGKVPAGETSLWLEVTAPHRAEAFASGQWVIDEMKRVVPIWKKTF